MEPAEHNKPKRLFIGIPVDVDARQQLAAHLAPLSHPQHAISWLPDHSWHITLAFLGAVDSDTASLLQQLFVSAWRNSHAFVFHLQQLVRFPAAHSSTLAAVGTLPAPLLHLHMQTLALLTQCHIPLTKQAFRPHISLGKIHDIGPAVDFRQPLNAALRVDRVNLYESVPNKEGRLYLSLNEVVLPS